MTLKLTYNQAIQLKHLFDRLIIPERPEDIAESLVKDLMIQIYKKLRNKLESKIKDGYSLTLNDVEAKAYYIYFQDRSFGPDWLYEATIILTQINEINKIYA